MTTTNSVCNKCNEPIVDKFIAIINNCSWHDQCVRCTKCGCQLTSKFYELDNEFLCPEDYVRKKFKKCFRCKGPIFPTERVLYTDAMAVFHQNCFKCNLCDRVLISGDKYYNYSTGSTIICQFDYDNVKLPFDFTKLDNYRELKSEIIPSDNDRMDSNNRNLQQTFGNLISHFGSNSSFGILEDDLTSDIDPSVDETFSSDNDKSCGIRRRTPRTTIKASQLDSLKATFTITPKPSRQMREKLAECTGLSMRVIQVWFQNRRSKERRSKMNTIRKLDKYRFSLRNDINREENLSDSPSNSRLITRNMEIQDIQTCLNSTPVNFDIISNVQTENFNENRYSSNWFINRSVDLLNN